MVVVLIAKDKNEKFQFEGRCKLTIDSVSKLLLVEPFNEEMISAMFNRKFVASKNILFVFGERDFQDFALIFDNTIICNKTYGFLVKQEAIIGYNTLIKERFLPPLFNHMSNSSEATLKMKEFLFKWIKLQDAKEKEEYIHMSNDYNIYDLKRGRRKYKKRVAKENFSNINFSDSYVDNNEGPPPKKTKLLQNDITNRIIVKPNFEVYRYTKRGIQKTTLIVFCSTNKKLCYEFYFSNYDQRHICLGCEKIQYLYAKIMKNVNGDEYVEQNKNQHICDLREFDPSKYRSDIVIKKPFFDIVESNASGKLMKYLFIFTSNEKKMCYKFTYGSYHNFFYCSRCHIQKHVIRAHVCKNKIGEEYVSIQDKQHVCEPCEYSTKKLEYEIVKAGDYEITRRRFRGRWLQKLYVFISNKKDYCYEFTFHEKKNYYICNSCINVSKVFVIAKIIKNDENEEYVQLNWKKHVCEPVKYEPENLILLFKPDFEIKKLPYKGVENTYLFLTHPNDKNLYKYWFCKKQNRFICNQCKTARSVMAKLRKDESGEEYVELGKNEHVCQSKEEPSGPNIINLPNFKVVNDGKDLFIFDETKKTLCYSYVYHPSRKNFVCRKCIAKKRKVCATLLQYRNGEDYLRTGQNSHICKPEKYQSGPIKREYRSKNY